MTTKMRQRRGHLGSTWYNYKGDRHGRHKSGRPKPGLNRKKKADK